jgi:hypothetical protein
MKSIPRSARLDAPGALHHIIARGIEQKKICAKDEENILGNNFIFISEERPLNLQLT